MTNPEDEIARLNEQIKIQQLEIEFLRHSLKVQPNPDITMGERLKAMETSETDAQPHVETSKSRKLSRPRKPFSFSSYSARPIALKVAYMGK